MSRFFRFIMVMFVLFGSMLVSSAQDLEQRSQTLLMTFVPNVQFSPIYIAIADGHFADAGFDVSLEYLNEPDVLDLVAADQEKFGIVSGEQVILATSQGREVVFVYEWFQQYPIGIVVDSASSIMEPADLAGAVVGLPGRFGATYSGLVSILSAADLTEQDITIEEIGFAAPEVFCLGVIDASAIYINNEPIQIRNRALQDDCGSISDVRVLPVSNYIDLVSNGLITNDKMRTENPEQVRGFVGALNAGVASVINNPAHAYLQSEAFIEGLPLSEEFRVLLEIMSAEQEDFLQTNPSREDIIASRATMLQTVQAQLPLDEITQFEVLMASIELWDAERLGFSDLESWVNMEMVLQALGALDEMIALEEIVTNDFLPETE